MYSILEGDVMEQLKTLADASVDAIVTDPPYGLEFMGKDWDAPWKTDHRQGFDGTMQTPDSPYGRSKVRNGNGASYGADMRVMQALQDWHECWAHEALRVLKPGGYLLAFGGSRTYHRLACAVEDAGFEIRDQIMWIYGSGFPKSLDVSKAIDKAAGAEREVISVGKPVKRMIPGADQNKTGWIKDNGREFTPTVTAAATHAASQWQGWGTALKPAHEPIVVARKPLVGTVAANVLEFGTGALNIDGCRIGNGEDKTNGGCAGTTALHEGGITNRNPVDFSRGRWPANVIHDGSDEVLEAFPDAPGQCADVKYDAEARKTQNIYGAMKRKHEPSGERTYRTEGGTNFAMKPGARRLDEGSAARFFYCAKASQDERGIGGAVKNTHPTVKPVELMAYLCRLVTPPGGTVLDCFMGSGSTGIAALRGGFDFIGIELNREYVEIARTRISADAPLLNQPTEEAEWTA
jgi:DNA modification methylase